MSKEKLTQILQGQRFRRLGSRIAIYPPEFAARHHNQRIEVRRYEFNDHFHEGYINLHKSSESCLVLCFEKVGKETEIDIDMEELEMINDF